MSVGKTQDNEKEENKMKMFLNFNGVWKSGTYATVPAEIYDEVEIILPKGFKEVTMKDESKAIEWPDGQITLAWSIKVTP